MGPLWREISSFDPPLTTVWTADSTQLLLALLDPPVELAAQ